MLWQVPGKACMLPRGKRMLVEPSGERPRKYVQEEGCEIAARASQLQAKNCGVDCRTPTQKDACTFSQTDEIHQTVFTLESTPTRSISSTNHHYSS